MPEPSLSFPGAAHHSHLRSRLGRRCSRPVTSTVVLVLCFHCPPRVVGWSAQWYTHQNTVVAVNVQSGGEGWLKSSCLYSIPFGGFGFVDDEWDGLDGLLMMYIDTGEMRLWSRCGGLSLSREAVVARLGLFLQRMMKCLRLCHPTNNTRERYTRYTLPPPPLITSSPVLAITLTLHKTIYITTLSLPQPTDTCSSPTQPRRLCRPPKQPN